MPVLKPLLLLGCACAAVCAQAPATYVTPTEMNAALKSAPNQEAPLNDRPVRVIDAGGHYLGVAMVRRTSADVNALIHDKIDEIYYVLEGGGTMVTGGSVVDGKKTESSATIGPGWSGPSIKGGETRRVNTGDVVFIPAGTAHMFTKLDGPIKYLVYRVDNSKVIALK